MKTSRVCKGLAGLLLATTMATQVQAVMLHMADIVPVPSAVNDFEAVNQDLLNSTWAQQGIRVTQINGDQPQGIWTASGLGLGQRSWYPDAGDDGFSRITLDNGNNFNQVSFFVGSGWITPPQALYFELLDDGNVVLNGHLNDATFLGQWMGFSGGDFDEIRLRATQAPSLGSLDDCAVDAPNRCNYLWLDNIKISSSGRQLPEPVTLALVSGALIAMLGRRRSSQPVA